MLFCSLCVQNDCLYHQVVRLLAYHQYAFQQEQLATQAETISSLTTQRDLLIRQHKEECANWEAERQGWDRSAERLIAQRSAAEALPRENVSTLFKLLVLRGLFCIFMF
jgi:hypothetical protein